MGSPAFAVPSLRALGSGAADVVLAISQPDRPAGRGGRLHEPEVKVAARELGIETWQPESFRPEEALERLRAVGADAFVVAAYGKILPQAVLDIPRRGTLNVHASLLPSWRGPSPIVASILAGDAVTGVSIMELVRKMDAGPVLTRVETAIGREETAGELEARLAQSGADELVRVLPAWLSGELSPTPQDEAAATYCHLIAKQDGLLRAESSAAEAARAVRAYNPWPGAFVLWGEERLTIWRAHATAAGAEQRAAAGDVGRDGRSLHIHFGDGLIVLDEVQRPGGKRISGEQFLAGLRGQLPNRVGLA
jgi:methionyl-tRNA formyltransferase